MTKLRALIIDDEKYRHTVLSKDLEDTHQVTSCMDQISAQRMIQTAPAFDVIYFDNDLGVYGGTGIGVAKWLLNECPAKVPPRVVIHSMNGVATENIISLFLSYTKVTNVTIEVNRERFDEFLLPPVY